MTGFLLVNVRVHKIGLVGGSFDECSTEEHDLKNRAYLLARKRVFSFGKSYSTTANITFMCTRKQLLLHTKSIELKKDIASRLTQRSEGMLLESLLRPSPAQKP